MPPSSKSASSDPDGPRNDVSTPDNCPAQTPAVVDEPSSALKRVDVAEALQQIDFSRYRTDELRQSIEAILSISVNFVFFIRALFLVWVLGPILLVLAFTESPLWVRLLWGAYGTLTFFFFGLGLAIFLTKRRLLRNVLGIVDIMFQVCEQVLGDLGQIKSRGVGATAAMLVSTVDGAVIQPVVEGVLTARLGFFARPLTWMYRGTIRRMTQAVESSLVDWAKTTDKEIEADNETRVEAGQDKQTALDRAQDVTVQVRDFTVRARTVALGTAERVTRFALLPSMAVATCAGVFALAPPLVARLIG